MRTQIHFALPRHSAVHWHQKRAYERTRWRLSSSCVRHYSASVERMWSAEMRGTVVQLEATQSHHPRSRSWLRGHSFSPSPPSNAIGTAHRRPFWPSPDTDTEPEPGTGQRGSKFNTDSIAAAFVLSTRSRSRIRSRQDDSPSVSALPLNPNLAQRTVNEYPNVWDENEAMRDENPDDVHTMPTTMPLTPRT
ncbi:hypothetical protein C8R44DRAFT_740391 [Mycena epipterygia]|nr:hypothetical protein C8R44DRAFT_740391 [Mycena epipterygia]